MPIILFIAFIVFLFVIDKPILNKFNVERKRRYKPVNKVHLWSEVLLFVLLTTIIYFSGLREYFLLILLTVLFTFRVFMEWKFAKESKAYIVSVLDGSRIILIVIAVSILLQP